MNIFLKMTEIRNKIIDGMQKQILIDGGYITFSGTTPQYHFYLQDHLGNNRVVCNASGTVSLICVKKKES